MNAPAPGWLPDPTGRHDYRYWDGAQWSDDVSDGGVTSVDPMAAAQGPGQPLGGQPVGGQPMPGYGAGAYGGAPPSYGSGPYAAAPRPGGGGPSTGLLVGLGALLVVLVVGVIVVLTNKDDDDPSTETTSNTTEADGTTSTTSGSDSGDSDDSDNSDDSGDGEVDQTVVDGIAAGIYESGDGLYTQEEADCIAEAMVEEIGLERLMEIGLTAIEEGEGDPSSVDPFEVLTDDELSAVTDAMIDCIGGDFGTDG